jgi:hypothetical protein
MMHIYHLLLMPLLNNGMRLRMVSNELFSSLKLSQIKAMSMH